MQKAEDLGHSPGGDRLGGTLVELDLSSVQSLQRALQAGGYLPRVDYTDDGDSERYNRGLGGNRRGGGGRSGGAAAATGRRITENGHGRYFDAGSAYHTRRLPAGNEAAMVWRLFRLSRGVTSLRVQRCAACDRRVGRWRGSRQL